jgi:hypothetical protein
MLYDNQIEKEIKKEYEKKYLDKFVEADNDVKGDDKIYFKVSKINVELQLVMYEGGEMIQTNVRLMCKNYIKLHKGDITIYNTEKEDDFACGFSGLINYIDRFIEVIDKQTFKDILKTNVNNIIHSL